MCVSLERERGVGGGGVLSKMLKYSVSICLYKHLQAGGCRGCAQ